MDMVSLIDFCKQNFPERAIDLCEAIDLIVDTLTNFKSDLGKSMSLLVDNDDYDAIDKYTNHAKTVSQIIQNLNNISNDITINNLDDDEQTIEKTEADYVDINYNDKSFNADRKIPHTLYEDFTYTKPAGIEIEGNYLEANEWRDVFNKCCQYLLNKSPDIFWSFLTDTTMQGRKCKYFSYNANELRDGVRIEGSKIYVENNVSAIFVRNIIIKMLEKYEIPKRNCHIFIRRDLTSLHGENAKLYEVEQNLKESTDDMKISQYARGYFETYFQSHTSVSDINQFTNKDWCHNTFGICYPILKQVNPNLPINEQINYNNEYRRYWVKPVLEIGSKSYVICKEWYLQFKQKLIDWAAKNSYEPGNNLKESLTQSDDKIKFPREYNSIRIPKFLFVHILNAIKEYSDKPFETGILSEKFCELITKNSDYAKPHHVINNIRKYLEHEGIISLYREAKKGKYVVADSVKLHKLIQRHDESNKNDNVNNTIAPREVIIYSYNDKKQIIVNVANPNDEYLYLHSYCINQKPGYRFMLQSNEYVVVSYKKSYYSNTKKQQECYN